MVLRIGVLVWPGVMWVTLELRKGWERGKEKCEVRRKNEVETHSHHRINVLCKNPIRHMILPKKV